MLPDKPAVQPVTEKDIETALRRIEKQDVATANMIRHYIRTLERRIQVYELGDDDEVKL